MTNLVICTMLLMMMMMMMMVVMIMLMRRTKTLNLTLTRCHPYPGRERQALRVSSSPSDNFSSVTNFFMQNYFDNFLFGFMTIFLLRILFDKMYLMLILICIQTKSYLKIRNFAFPATTYWVQQ